MAHFTFLAFKNLTLWLFYVDVMLASCKLKISQTMPSWGKLSTLHFLFVWMFALSLGIGHSGTLRPEYPNYKCLAGPCI
jgi:hypothetical protein